MAIFPLQLSTTSTARTLAVYTCRHKSDDHRHALHGDVVCNHPHTAQTTETKD